MIANPKDMTGVEVNMASECFIDPRDIINRAAEQELFAGLVSFATPARMMVISDKLGRGKSTLLRRLEYNCNCMIKPLVSACSVDLKDLPETSPFAFAEKVSAELTLHEGFANFAALSNARTRKNFAICC